MGDTPHRWAKEASWRRRSGLSSCASRMTTHWPARNWSSSAFALASSVPTTAAPAAGRIAFGVGLVAVLCELGVGETVTATRTVTVLEDRDVSPPSPGTTTTPGGQTVNVGTSTDPQSGFTTITVPNGQVSGTCTPLPIEVKIDPGGGTVSNANLILVARWRGNHDAVDLRGACNGGEGPRDEGLSPHLDQSLRAAGSEPVSGAGGRDHGLSERAQRRYDAGLPLSVVVEPAHDDRALRLQLPVGRDQQRYEGKLTLSPFSGHRLTASYIEIEDLELGNFFGTILDTRSVNNRSTPQDLLALNYTGVWTSNFFTEAQYSWPGGGSQPRQTIRGPPALPAAFHSSIRNCTAADAWWG